MARQNANASKRAAENAVVGLPGWLCRVGASWDATALRFASSDLHGAGVFALRDIMPGEKLATVPKSACLSVRSSGARKKLEKLITDGTIDDEIALILAILYEQKRGNLSPWAGYFSTLSHDVPHTPQVWRTCEQALLVGTEVQRNASLRPSRRAAESRSLHRAMHGLMQELMPCRGKVTFKEFARAQYWSESRAFFIDEAIGEAMVPLADLFNHKAAVIAARPPASTPAGLKRSRHPNIALDLVIGNAGARDKNVSIVAKSPIPKGNEIFNCYGEKGNAELLANYGFVCSDNSHDALVIQPAEVVAAAARMKRQSRSLVRQTLLMRLRGASFNGAVAARREASTPGEESAESCSEDEQSNKYFKVRANGRVPAALIRVASAAAGSAPTLAAARPVLLLTLQRRRTELRAAGTAVGAVTRRTLAAKLAARERQLVNSLESALKKRRR